MTAQFSIASDIRAVLNGDGGVLLNLNRGVCYSLNGVGAQVWSLLAGSRQGLQPDAIVDQLAQRFSVPRQRLAEDVVTFLGALADKGLVQSQQDFHLR